MGHKNEHEIGHLQAKCSEVCLCRSDESQNFENDAKGNDPMVSANFGFRSAMLYTYYAGCEL